MERETKIIKLKLDIIFKRIFGNEKNDKIITAFIEDLLEMKRGTI
ncbi:MAG: PD-(D/E)XK nuclease family transposase [Oscillospiraceae bacterium]